MTDLLPLMPLITAAVVLSGLLLILRLLRHSQLVRGLTFAYVVGTLLLSLGLLLDGSGVLGESGRTLLLALLFSCWGYVGLVLAEHALLERWLPGVRIPRLVRDIGRVVLLLGLVLLLCNLLLGVELNSFIISSTVISAVVGLALQDLLKSAVAGIALQAERPFSPGDWVRINNQTARVVEMSWRATRVITVDSVYIIIPNDTLAQQEIINYSVGAPVALHLQVPLHYGHAPNLVKQVLMEATLAAPGVIPMPRPSIKLIAHNEYSMTYDIKFWMSDFSGYPEKMDAVMTSAWYHLRRAGLLMPLPVREVYMRQVTAEGSAAAEQARLAEIASLLRSVALFAPLADDELSELADRVGLRVYGVGERLVQQGEVGESLFLLRRGRVRIDVLRGSDSVTVNELGPGAFFGEMALLTGEPRSASVTALEDTETLVVARDALAPLLQRNSLLPEMLGDELLHRARMTAERLAAHQAETSNGHSGTQISLVERIRSIFGLAGH